MVEIKEIVGVDDLYNFLNDTPEEIHVVLFDNDQEHAPNCIMENLENLSTEKVGNALFAIADMNKTENEPLKTEREFYIFPSVEFFKNNKSYVRHLGHLNEFGFYEIIDEINEGYYIPSDETENKEE